MEEHVKYSSLTRQIEDLKFQKAALIERINSVCKLQLGRMAENIPEDELAVFFKQVKERNIHFDKVGVLFQPRALKKYDSTSKRRSASVKENKSRQVSRSGSRATLDESYNSEEEVLNGICTCGNRGENRGSSKANKMMSQYSMAGLKVAKKHITLLQRKIAQLQGNFEELSKRNSGNYKKYLEMVEENEKNRKTFVDIYKTTKEGLVNKSKTTQKKLENLCLQYNDKLNIIKELKTQLDLYKDMIGINDLSDSDLGDLEKHLWTKMDEIKIEKARRIVNKESGKLPFIQGSSSNIEYPEDFVVISPEEKDDLSDKDICVDAEITKGGNIFTLEEEIGEFARIFKEGLSEVDQEIEQMKNATIEIPFESKENDANDSKEFSKGATKKVRDDASIKSRSISRHGSTGQIDFKLDLIDYLASSELDASKLRSSVDLKGNKKVLGNINNRQDKVRDITPVLRSETRDKSLIASREGSNKTTKAKAELENSPSYKGTKSTGRKEEVDEEPTVSRFTEALKEMTVKNVLKEVKSIDNPSLSKSNSKTGLQKATNPLRQSMEKNAAVYKAALESAKEKLQRSATTKLLTSRVASIERIENVKEVPESARGHNGSGKKGTGPKSSKTTFPEDLRGRNEALKSVNGKRTINGNGKKSVDNGYARRREIEDFEKKRIEDGKLRLNAYIMQAVKHMNKSNEIDFSNRTKLLTNNEILTDRSYFQDGHYLMNSKENIHEGMFEDTIQEIEQVTAHESLIGLKDEIVGNNANIEGYNRESKEEIERTFKLEETNTEEMVPEEAKLNNIAPETISDYERNKEVDMKSVKNDTLLLTSEIMGFMSNDLMKLQQSNFFKSNEESMLSELNHTAAISEENKKRRTRAERQKQRLGEGEISEEST